MTSSPAQNVYIFGIRHHGPGSARSLRKALEELQPDIVLVEGPPDAEAVLPLVAGEGMEPPVAILIYRPDQPSQAVYYPFATFSPEWQALNYALTGGIPARFMDLPQALSLAMEPANPDRPPEDAPAGELPEGEALPGEEPPAEITGESDSENETDLETAEKALPEAQSDPLEWLARAAGYSDGERWWEQMVEHRQDSGDLFQAILEAMTVLRSEIPPRPDPQGREARREAYMRQTIRAAQRENFQKIAVVCGAWHAPALAKTFPAKEDAALLKDMPRVKVQATWIPWTYGRLSYFSGYGAGIESPGWYDHLWKTRSDVAIRWLTKVARLLREEDIDVSSAHVIEGVRLSEALAALRDRPLPGLPELNEATLTVLCSGNDTPLRLIQQKLIVGERLGRVPGETPMVALQQNLTAEQKRLRLKPEAAPRTLDLDQRQPIDLERSYLLHRLNLLGIQWGFKERTTGQRGTFHEIWLIQWQPELAVRLIEASMWGTTVLEAATSKVRHQAAAATTLPELTRLVDQTLLAELPDAIDDLMLRVQNVAAVSSDVGHLMEALPPLANVLRYGNVRKAHSGPINAVVEGLLARIIVGLPGATGSLNDEAAREMDGNLVAVHNAVSLLQNEDYSRDWQKLLVRLAGQTNLHGLLAGRCCRLLMDAGAFDIEETARRMGLALSPGVEPPQAAAWVEGFLSGSGQVLLHDTRLWQVLDDWVNTLDGEIFQNLLPLLRRTFSAFSNSERRQMGEQAKQRGSGRVAAATGERDFDYRRARKVLPVVARLLGLPEPEVTEQKAPAGEN
jgi:hypothetical protein